MTVNLFDFAPLAASVLVAAIWQGALLALAVGLGLKLLPRLSAAARSVVWLVTFVAAVLFHVTPLLLSHPAGSDAHVVHADPRWSLALAAVWLGLSGIRAVQLLASAVHLRRIARASTPVEASSMLDLPRNGVLCTSNAVDRPSVAGFFAPRILIPQTLLAALSASELEQVLLHETEHLRRGDDWTNLLQKLALVIFPLNPVLLWVERRLCLERELACDDRVLAAAHNGQMAARKAYARCLTGLAEHAALRRALAPALTLALGAWQRQSELARRVYRILSRPSATLSRPRTLAAAGTLLAGVIAAASGLAHVPLLVSFAPAAFAPMHALAIAPAAEYGDGARMVEAKAIMPPTSSREHGSRSTDGPRWTHATQRKPSMHAARIRSFRPNQPRAVSITYRSDAAAPPVIYSVTRTVSWSSASFVGEAQPAAGNSAVLQKASSSSMPALVPVFAYAAVPTPNGWLIIQL